MTASSAPAGKEATETAIVAALGARSVVLVGMMGAGKSTVGRRLATRLNLPFVDADQEIEAAAGKSISDIFAEHGEPHFRDGEAKVIARLLQNGPVVLATGGGAVLRDDTRERIRAHGISIWLKADVDTVLRRVRRRSNRPLLQTADQAETVARLIAEREPLYSQAADIIVVSRDVAHEKIADECLAALADRLISSADVSARPAVSS
jgi:shikimate kinase